jgi:GTPase SAR1 family protein
LKIEELVLIHLDNLEKLDISNNNLQIFHYEDLRKLPKIEYLKLYGNPIQNIPAEIFDKDENVLQDVRDYFLELEKGKIINEKAKLIIVGNGRVGKTSLFKRLKGDDFDTNEKYTHGIQIGELAKKDLAEAKTENLQLKVWDFGGQEIFYATHQFFMGDDAIYILAWTKEENVKAYRERDKATLPTDEKWQSLEYWLDTIRRHAPNSPILVVQTHSDCSNEHINQSVLSQESSANDFFNFSAAKDFGLAEIKNALTQKLNQLPMYGYEFPKTYENVILQIENRQKAGENIITYQTFVDTICRLANISEGGEDTLLDYLDKSGVVVYYKNHPKLKNLIYINPNWLTQQVYRLINNELHKTEGKISLKYLEMHLPDYEQFGLLDLFQQFELIFKVKEEKEKYWIAPQYLLEKRSDEFHEAIEDEIKAYNLFVYRFERFVPDNLMINFISRYGSFSKKTYWKNGIKFTKEVEKEFLVCITIYKPESKSFFIYTQKHSNQKSLLKRIVNDFIELGKNAKTEFSFDNQDFVSYQKLQKLYEKGAKEIESIDGNILKISDFTFLFKEEEPNNNMKNQTFIQQLNEATELKISELLGIIKNQYEKIPWDLRNDFNNLKQEFKDQPNNFALSKWKAKMITLVNDFDFEITVDNVEIITQPPNNMSNQQNAKDENGKIVINFNPIITNNNTNTNQNSNSQSFNFEAFAQALPNFQSYLSLLEEEFEKIEKKNPNNQVITNAKELVKDTLESANKIESITEKKDEKEIKKSTFWKRLGNFGNWLFKSGKELLSPDSIQNIGKSGNELAKLGQAFGIETGFDFSNFGSE